MKGKKLWAMILTACMTISSFGMMSVMAEEQQTDATLSVSITKDGNPVSYLKAGDEITVAVNLDNFKSVTIADDTNTQYKNTDGTSKNKDYGNKKIHTISFSIPYDTAYFEPVLDANKAAVIEVGSAGYIDAKAISVDTTAKNPAAMVATVTADISETTTGGEIVKFQLKVKDTVETDTQVTFNVQDVILKNYYLDSNYAVTVESADVTLQIPPVVTFNDSTTPEETYETAVTVKTAEGTTLTVNGEEVTSPYTISAAGTYTVVAANVAGSVEKKFEIVMPSVDGKKILTSDATGIYVAYDDGVLSDDVILQAKLLKDGEDSYAEVTDLLQKLKIDTTDISVLPYEIALVDGNSKEVQLTDNVTVQIPCPDAENRSNCKVYYITESNTLSDVGALVSEDGYLTFNTKELGTYLVSDAELNSAILYGDVNGDGLITLMDSALIRRHLAGWTVTLDEKAADVNKDGVITLTDGALIRRYLAGWNVTLG